MLNGILWLNNRTRKESKSVKCALEHHATNPVNGSMKHTHNKTGEYELSARLPIRFTPDLLRKERLICKPFIAMQINMNDVFDDLKPVANGPKLISISTVY